MAPGGEAVRARARSLARDGRKRVMLVGHEPDLSALAAALLGDFGEPFEKAMVVGVQALVRGGRSPSLRPRSENAPFGSRRARSRVRLADPLETGARRRFWTARQAVRSAHAGRVRPDAAGAGALAVNVLNLMS